MITAANILFQNCSKPMPKVQLVVLHAHRLLCTSTQWAVKAGLLPAAVNNCRLLENSVQLMGNMHIAIRQLVTKG